MKKHSTLVAALVMGLALPAFAQDGFRVGLSTGSMKTTSESASIGLNQVPTGGGFTVNTYTQDQPTQSPLALDLAWVRGDDEYAFTYFNGKKSATTTLPTNTTNPYQLGILLGGSFPNAMGNQEFKATMIDLGWKHTFAKGDMGSAAFSLGLRSSSVSDEITNTYADAAGTPQEQLHVKGKGTGIGLTAGLHGRMNFNDRCWLTGGYTLGMINNKVSSDDYTLTPLSGPGSPIVFNTPDNHKSLLQTEAYLRFNMNFVSTFNGYLGYEVKNFGDDAAKVNNIYSNLGLGTTSGFGLSGFTLGVSYTF
ncbi:MAG: hypothetical protein JST05_10870 [Acidobacteria bacterium]|nr:hypothetical protein [Acidobacteriota bacterium]